MTTMTPRQFIDTLSDCGLLTAEEASAAAERFADVVSIDEGSDGGTLDGTGPGPAETQVRPGANGGSAGSTAGSIDPATQAVARQLIADGKLTKFQARAVLGGAAKGLRIGEYVVLEKIGAGGMGTVYKARHRVMKRTVAIKLLPRAATQNPRMVQRFYREVEAAAALTHPNIVTAYDAGEAEGIHYLVSEFVDGLDLSALLKKTGPLPLERAVDYIVQAGRGLAYAHEHGVIHRDVKPGNMLLSRDGVVKMLDMGLARFTEADAHIDEASLTVTGRLMGTVEYMAPEHAVNPKNADHRSDIYSLGCTFYRLITGRLPYKGETAVELIIAQREQPTPRLADEVTGVPEAVQRVFERMLAKSPDDRYATMAEAIDALAAAAKATNLPAAAAPSASEFDPRTDSQATRTNTRVKNLLGDSALIGELAAAASGIHDAIEPAPAPALDAEPAFLRPNWTPGGAVSTPTPARKDHGALVPVIMLAIVAAAAAIGVIWAFAGMGDKPAPVDPMIASTGGTTPNPGSSTTTNGAGTNTPTNPTQPLDPIKPLIDEATKPTTPTDPTTTTTNPTDPTTPGVTAPLADPFDPLAPAAVGEWRSLFDGVNLDRWARITGSDQLGDEPGPVAVEGRQILLMPGAPITGITWTGASPRADYELTMEARLDDAQMLSVTFPVGESRAAVQLDVRQSRVGLFRIDDASAADNAVPTKVDGGAGGWQRLRVRVSPARIGVWLNEQPVIDQSRTGHTFGAPAGYHPMQALTVYVARGGAALRNIRARRLEPEPGADPAPVAPPVAGPVVIEPSDDWHDLLASIDTARDERGGARLWSLHDGALVGQSTRPDDASRAPLLIPVQITGSYQLRMSLNTRQGGGPIVLSLPAADGRLALVIDGPKGTGFASRKPDAADDDRAAARRISQRTAPSPGTYDVQVMIRVSDDRVTAAAKVGARSVPTWTGPIADLVGGRAERILDRIAERRGPASDHAVVLRIGDRQLTIDSFKLNILPGGRATLQPVAPDDAGDEMIDLGAPPAGQPRQPTRPGAGEQPQPLDPNRPQPPRPLPPRNR